MRNETLIVLLRTRAYLNMSSNITNLPLEAHLESTKREMKVFFFLLLLLPFHLIPFKIAPDGKI